MKKLLLLMMSVAALTLNAQVFTEYFEDATPGQNLEDYNDWYVCFKESESLGVSPVIGIGDPLWYPDYAGSEVGHVVEIDSVNGYDSSTQRISTKVVTDGTDTLKLDSAMVCYAAFLVKPQAQSYDSYRDIFTWEQSSGSNFSRGRVFMRLLNGTDIQWAVSKNSSSDFDTSDVYTNAIDEVFLMVLSYEAHGDKAEDDTVKLWINPDPTLPVEEQDDPLVNIDTKSDYSFATMKINIRQRGHNAEIGGIRVGTDWKEVLQQAVTGVSLDQTTLTLDPGTTGTLVATVEPANAGDPSVTWSSSNEDVATVDDGVVTAVTEGTATITVTTTDGGFTDECEVTVSSGTGVSEASVENVSVYPNPSTGAFTIANSEGADVAIYNVAGKVVFQKSDLNNNELVNANLSQGMYFVRVTKENYQGFTKLIIK